MTAEVLVERVYEASTRHEAHSHIDCYSNKKHHAPIPGISTSPIGLFHSWVSHIYCFLIFETGYLVV